MASVVDTHSSRFFSGGAASNTTQAQQKVSAKVANLKRARPTADNIDEVDNVKQTKKEPNNIKKSQKQKNAEVDRLCAIDSSKDGRRVWWLAPGGVSHNQEWTTIKGPRQRRFVALLALYMIILLDILVFIFFL